MPYRRAVLIFNPVSGPGSRDGQLDRIGRILREGTRALTLAPTEAPEHATELARDAAASGCDLVAVLGGDGTVNEAVQGLAGCHDTSLLVLPGGTANVLVRELGLPTNAHAVAGLLPILQQRTIRLGLAESSEGYRRYFLLMCGAGLDAAIAARATPPMKRKYGQAAFWWCGAQQAVRPFPTVRVVLGGQEQADHTSSLVVVSKSRTYGGGLVFTPKANLLAERLEVARFTGTNPVRYCGYLVAGICAATSWWPGIFHDACEDLRLESTDESSVPFQLDGEVAGELPVRVSASAVSLRLLLPAAYGEKLPVGIEAPVELPVPAVS